MIELLSRWTGEWLLRADICYTLEQIEEYRMHLEYVERWLSARRPK